MTATDLAARPASPGAARARWRLPGPLLMLELRRNAMPFLLPLAAALFWFDAWRTAEGFPAIWGLRAAVIPNHVFPDLGPFSAGVAAWMGSREHRHGISDLVSVTARPRWLRQIITWAATAGWALSALAGCVAVVYVTTARQASWGGPLWWPVAVAAAAVVLCCTVGFVAGALFPSRFTTPLAAVGTLLVFVVAFRAAIANTSGVTQISPSNRVPSPDLGVFYPYLPDLSIVQLMFLGGLTVAAIGALGLPAAAGGLALRRTAAAITAAGLVVSATGVGLAATAVAGPHDGVVIAALHDAATDRPIRYTPVCDPAAVQICMHPAFRADLSKVAAALEPVLDAVAGLPGAPGLVEQLDSQSAQLQLSDRHYSVELALGAAPGGAQPVLEFGFEDSEAFDPGGPAVQFRTQAGVLIVGSIVGSNVGSKVGTVGLATDPAQQAVEAALLEVAGVPLGISAARASGSAVDAPAPVPGSAIDIAARRLAALPAATRQAWLVSELSALRAGQVSLAELP